MCTLFLCIKHDWCVFFVFHIVVHSKKLPPWKPSKPQNFQPSKFPPLRGNHRVTPGFHRIGSMLVAEFEHHAPKLLRKLQVVWQGWIDMDETEGGGIAMRKMLHLGLVNSSSSLVMLVFLGCFCLFLELYIVYINE